ncbi:MAG: FxsA family protein [Bacillota bacterium]
MIKLLWLLIAVPVIELIIMIKIGAEIGFWPTLALVVIPGIIGAAMARSQGIKVISAVKGEIIRGRLPGSQIVDGVLILCGALLLVTPGVITDLIGLSVLLPNIRSMYRKLIAYRFLNMIANRKLRVFINR